ncbi:cysteine rich repeat-containing protein [Mesorhizobium sp. VNQ89]|uniref:cysteine rich repeat-containing protein n=1 Tax=Mesorhizobium quangtriensis TaxID=3157709 RepID=UPI0032B86239
MKWLVSFFAAAFIISPGVALAQTAAERQACQADFEKYCPGVQPGGGRVIKCLSEHLDHLTPQCKSVVEANMPK